MLTLSSIPTALIASLFAGPGPMAPDACSLLTQEIAAAALGEAVKGPKGIAEMKDGAGNTVSSCEYTGSGYNRVQVDLMHMAKQMVPMMKKMCQEKATKDLAGIGELACWYNEKHGELHAFKGDLYVSVQLKRDGDPTEAIKATMKKAVDRLK